MNPVGQIRLSKQALIGLMWVTISVPLPGHGSDGKEHDVDEENKEELEALFTHPLVHLLLLLCGGEVLWPILG